MSFLYNFDLAKYLLVPEGFYTLFNVLVVILFIIIMLLKGLALWRSARLGQKVWFWIFIFVNTLGILEIVYLIAYRDGFNQDAKKIKKLENKKLKKENTDINTNENVDLAEKQNLDMNNWVS